MRIIVVVIIERGLIEGSFSKKKHARQSKIENHREPKNKYGNETKLGGIVRWRNCDAPG